MQCTNCGKEVQDEALFCNYCGLNFQNKPSESRIPPASQKGIGWLGVLCFLIPLLGLILFLVWMNTQPKKAKGAGISALIGFICGIIFSILLAIAVPMYMRYVEKSRSTEAQTAISEIRKSYDTYGATNGNLDGYSSEMAVREANLSEETLRNWQFDVVGNPPYMYIATSTYEFAGGEGKQVWFDMNDRKFHGYGVDQETDPSASMMQPEPPIADQYPAD